MTLKEFIDLCIDRLASLYPAPEAKSIAFRLLEHYTDIPSYKYISEPDTIIDDQPAGGSGCCSRTVAPGRDPSQAALGPLPLTVPRVARVLEQSPTRPKGGLIDQLLGAVAELETGRPLQYVLGVTEFCGHRFRVGEGCLIPRPETEELVSRIIDDLYSDDAADGNTPSVMPGLTSSVMPGLTGHLESPDDSPFSILDLCTGSGCIAWSLAAEFPEAMVYGCDLSDAALRYACRQRVKVRGAKPIFFTADVLAEPPAGLPKFDVIVSNPPYICDSERSAMRPNVLDFEPAEALFVPDDDPLRFYRAIARWADALLRPDGHLYLEINERFGPEVAALFPGAGIVPDISGRDRFVIR